MTYTLIIYKKWRSQKWIIMIFALKQQRLLSEEIREVKKEALEVSNRSELKATFNQREWKMFFFARRFANSVMLNSLSCQEKFC